MSDDPQVDRRGIDPVVAKMQADVAVSTAAIQHLAENLGRVEAGQHSIAGKIDRLSDDLVKAVSDPAASPLGREITRRQDDADERAGKTDDKIDSLESWRDELRGAFRLAALACGVSVLSALASIAAIYSVFMHASPTK